MLMQTFAVPLASMSAGHIANIVKGYAIAGGVAFGIWFVWQWWRKRLDEIVVERAARARAAWRQHLDLALRHPELAEPLLGAQPTPLEAARYRRFVASLLATADKILTIEPTEGWRETLARSLRAHGDYFKSAEFREGDYRDCSEDVRALVDRIGRS